MGVKNYQDPREWADFLELIRGEGVRSYLEIGSKFGDSFVSMTISMPQGSRAVSVEIKPKDSFRLRVSALNVMGCDASIIKGNSTDPAIVEAVRKLGPFDLCFIDGDHSYEGAMADWLNYGPMARIVAFHDIAWKERPGVKNRLELFVPTVWQEIRGRYRHAEISHMSASMGIGILWRE